MPTPSRDLCWALSTPNPPSSHSGTVSRPPPGSRNQRGRVKLQEAGVQCGNHAVYSARKAKRAKDSPQVGNSFSGTQASIHFFPRMHIVTLKNQVTKRMMASCSQGGMEVGSHKWHPCEYQQRWGKSEGPLGPGSGARGGSEGLCQNSAKSDKRSEKKPEQDQRLLRPGLLEGANTRTGINLPGQTQGSGLKGTGLSSRAEGLHHGVQRAKYSG